MHWSERTKVPCNDLTSDHHISQPNDHKLIDTGSYLYTQQTSMLYEIVHLKNPGGPGLVQLRFVLLNTCIIFVIVTTITKLPVVTG